MSIRILIADDHAVLRSGVRALLSQEPDMQVVAEAGTGGETIHLLQSHGVDVLILDISMPGTMSGSQVAEEVRRQHPNIQIVVLTMHEDEYYVREMLKLGVRAFVLKRSSARHLTEAVRGAYQRRHYVDPALSHLMVSAFSGRPVEKGGGRLEQLTGREQEVCSLLALGHTNAEVAERLSISARTVETHRANIMAKLGLKNRAELVRFAAETGILKFP